MNRFDESTAELALAIAHFGEKYDGVHAIWTGDRLETLEGNPIHAPGWFTAPLPAGKPLAGELWTGHGQFDDVRVIVCRRNGADHPDWMRVRLQVFLGADNLSGAADFIHPVEWRPIESRAALDAAYHAIVAADGEGIVIRFPDGRMVKRKPVSDDEGVVTARIDGSGRFAGRCSGVVLRLRSGRLLKVSSGMNADLRKNPPPDGTVVKFAFDGQTAGGLPRFPRIIGVRAEKGLEFAG